MHKHEGTTAAIRLMDKQDLRELQKKELYFSQYFPTWKDKVLNKDTDQALSW
jgi:hypothetical protein